MLDAQIIGPADTPFEGGAFELKIEIPHEYPMDPPIVTFVTRVCMYIYALVFASDWEASYFSSSSVFGLTRRQPDLETMCMDVLDYKYVCLNVRMCIFIRV
jgi:hypothetical protein